MCIYILTYTNLVCIIKSRSTSLEYMRSENVEKNEALASARKEKGFTQEELAGMLGYSKAAVSNWENGHSIPSLTDAFKLASILTRGIEQLFPGLYVQEQHTFGGCDKSTNIG